MSFLRRWKRPLAAVLAALVVLTIFAVFWVLQVRQNTTKGRSEIINDSQDTITQPLNAETADGGVRQTFTYDGPVYALGFVPSFAGDFPEGEIRLALYDGGGVLLAEAGGGTGATVSGSWALLHLQAPVQSTDGRYTAVFWATTQDGIPYALYRSDAAPAGWSLAQDGRPVDGALCLLVMYEQIGSFLTRFYWVFAALCALAAAGFVLLFSCRRAPLAVLYAAVAGGLCLLYLIILPPFSAPDEQFHINDVFTSSSVLMGQTQNGQPLQITVRRVGDQNTLVEDKNTTVFTYREIVSHLFETGASNEPHQLDEMRAGGYLFLYAPAVITVTFCRLLGLGFVPALLIARFVTAAVYVALTSLAVHFVPFAKSVFIAVGLLPMSLHIAASFNRDNLLLALYMLFVALCLYYAYQKPALNLADILVLGVLAFIAGPGKVIYAPLLLVLLLIPAHKFRPLGRTLGPLVATFIKVIILLLAGRSFIDNAWMVMQSFLGALKHSTSGAAVGAAAPALPAVPINPDKIRYNIGWLVTSPGRVVVLLLNTLVTQGTHYLSTLVGGELGYFNLPLNGIFVPLLYLLLAYAVIPYAGERRLPTRAKWISYGLSFVIVAAVFVVCLNWTPTYYTYLYGLQGRYFLPTVPLLLCAVHASIGGLRKTRDTARRVVLLFGFVNLAVLLNAFLFILGR